ncbi:MAG: ribbon-helix-helix protein, CopG family [Actinobacteria bacterium]|nr:MAG: ribbon-helix-helix protein, CopG family [Actinomycetota bacterium]
MSEPMEATTVANARTVRPRRMIPSPKVCAIRPDRFQPRRGRMKPSSIAQGPDVLPVTAACEPYGNSYAMVVHMARRQVLVQLDDARLAALDRLAGVRTESRSSVIRQALDLYLESIDEGIADLRYADAYRRIPEDLDELAGLRSLGVAAWPER